MPSMQKIIVFTDGSSRGNPGPGGWGAVVVDMTGKVVELGGREDHTTNNRMELMAAKEALTYIESKKLTGSIAIHTDSAYLLNGVTGWIHGWEKNGWKTKTGDDVLNQDIWKELGMQTFRLKNRIEWVKVSGHSGHRGNDRVDAIATAAADKTLQVLFRGDISQYEKLIEGSLFDETGTGKAPSKSKPRNKGVAYSYVSSLDGKVQVHKTWAECEARVKGKSGVRYKKVFSKDEEASLVAEWGK